MKKIYVFTLLGLGILMGACTSEKETDNSSKPKEVASDTLVDSITFHRTSIDVKSECNGGTENKFTYQGVFPVATEDTVLNQLLTSILVQRVGNSFMIEDETDYSHIDSLYKFKPLLSNWQKTFFDDACEAQDGFDMAMSWEMSLENDVERNSEGVLTLSFSQYSFTGGAHGNGSLKYVNVDLHQKKIIGVEDIIIDTVAFKKLGEAKMRAFFDLSEDDSFMEVGLTTEEFPMTDNLGFTENGVILFYNSYEIGPYSMGTVDLEFTYEELIGIIKDEYNLKSKPTV